MPSFVSLMVRGQIRLVKPVLDRMSIPKARRFQDALGGIMAKALAGKVSYAPLDLEGCEACFALPGEERDSRRAILYLHGGAYVAGNLQYAMGFAGILADRMGQRVLCAAYRLAPEHPYPAALQDALTAYRHLLEAGWQPRHITLAGESAGGGLAFCLCLQLKAMGLPQPGRVVALSPWTDLTFGGASYRFNARRDPSLSEDILRFHASAYARGQEDNPLVSPLLGELSGLPPSLILAGGRELMLSDAQNMADRLKGAGCDCTLHVAEGLWHVYPLFGIPEAQQALAKITEFMEYGDEG